MLSIRIDYDFSINLKQENRHSYDKRLIPSDSCSPLMIKSDKCNLEVVLRNFPFTSLNCKNRLLIPKGVSA